MADLFSDPWMQRFMEEWNKDQKLISGLAHAGFSATIAYGFEGEELPRGVIVVEQGQAIAAGAYQAQKADWDLRATPENWDKWLKNGLGTMALGMAYSSRKMKFYTGDYKAMVKNPSLAGPFVESFSVMGRV